MIFAAGQAGAAGFGVSPGSLNITLEEGSEVSRQLLIYNTGFNAADFSITTGAGIKAFPSSGRIDGKKSAVVEIKVIGARAGLQDSDIMVSIAEPSIDGEISFSLGTVIPVSVKTLAGKSLAANAFGGGLLSLGIIFSGIVVYRLIRQKRPSLSARFI